MADKNKFRLLTVILGLLSTSGFVHGGVTASVTCGGDGNNSTGQCGGYYLYALKQYCEEDWAECQGLDNVKNETSTPIPPPPVSPPQFTPQEEPDSTVSLPLIPPPPPMLELAEIMQIVDESDPPPPAFIIPPPPPPFDIQVEVEESARPPIPVPPPPLIFDVLDIVEEDVPPPMLPPPPPLVLTSQTKQPQMETPPPPPLVLPPPPREIFTTDEVRQQHQPPFIPPPPALIFDTIEVEKDSRSAPPPHLPPPPVLELTVMDEVPPPLMIAPPPPPMIDYICPDNIPEDRDCKSGYMLDKISLQCSDIDECLLFHDCTGLRVCKNTRGSYKCVCRSGYNEVGGMCKADTPTTTTTTSTPISTPEATTSVEEGTTPESITVPDTVTTATDTVNSTSASTVPSGSTPLSTTATSPADSTAPTAVSATTAATQTTASPSTVMQPDSTAVLQTTNAVVVTTPATCGFGEMLFIGQCRTFTTRSCSMRLTSEVFVPQLNDQTSVEFVAMSNTFLFVYRQIFQVINIQVYGVQLTYSNGSVIGAGNIFLPSSVTEDAATLETRVTEVIANNETDVVSQYGVSSASIADFNQCTDNTANDCHLDATCTNVDPGYSCSCNFGYRDNNITNPGKSCEPQCQLNGEAYCMNGGTCSNSVGGADPTCGCTTFFQGLRCAETNGGAIAGVVLGVLAGVGLIVLGVVLFLRYKKKQEMKKKMTEDREDPDEVENPYVINNESYSERF